MAGVDIRTLQDLMGQRSIMTPVRYAHLAPGHRAAAVELLVGSTDTATDIRVSEAIEEVVAVPA